MSEDTEQKEVVKWFRKAYPAHVMSLRVSQTGGYIGKGKAAAIRTAKKKAEGMVVGEADIVILVPKGGFGCFMSEHKGEGQAHKVSEAQQAYLDYHNQIGNCAVSTRGVEALKAAIAAYMEE